LVYNRCCLSNRKKNPLSKKGIQLRMVKNLPYCFKSKRSNSITLFQAATKSCMNLCSESLLP